MDQGTAPDPATWSLRHRGPAHDVSHRCLDAQRAARPRRRLARLLGADPLHPDAATWYRGALDERRVGGILTALGDGWRGLHAVPRGGGDSGIDHLVVGPPGVFTITSGIASAELEARVASRSLTRATGVPVGAAAIVVDPGNRPDVPAAVTVVPAGRLLRHLRGLPAVLGPDLAASIARAAEEWTTWQPFGIDTAHSDPDDAFERLHREVIRARVRRAGWQVAALVGVTAPVAAIVSGIVA